MDPIRTRKVEEQPATCDAASMLEGFSALLEQIGTNASPVVYRPQPGSLEQIEDVAGLKFFLDMYVARHLPGELKSIVKAHGHASAGEARELLALDKKLGTQPEMLAFAAASRRVGQSQLRKLRPLRDHRVLQRYVAAFDAGAAKAWHTIVYGIMLAVYSFPLRQGLLRYTEATLAGLVTAVEKKGRLPEDECEKLLNNIYAQMPKCVESALTNTHAQIGLSSPHKLRISN